MNGWTSDEIERVAAAEELQLATRRRDGTLRNALPVWVVRHGDDLYVRSVNGRGATWFRGALATGEGHVRAGGVDRDVSFVETDDLKEEIDAAYQAKYGRRYPSIVPSIVSDKARSAAVKLVPH
ncbi:MAG TPA: DUF2255 family protein [Chloroflexota bacterium]|jgi:hypothetical protein|nr:DUF2255 family protein [Chloroflexota bacterium]